MSGARACCISTGCWRAKTSGIARDKPAEVLSLLAISFIAIGRRRPASSS